MTNEDIVKYADAHNLDLEYCQKTITFLRETDYAKCKTCEIVMDLKFEATCGGNENDALIATELTPTGELDIYCPPCFEDLLESRREAL